LPARPRATATRSKIGKSRNQNEQGETFVEKWVLPFYSNGISNADEPIIAQFATAAQAIDLDIVHRLQ
jgi:hypothetical protein